MPVLARFKRKAARTTRNRALGADAVQSATCAYLAAIKVDRLAVNAAFHIHWVDSSRRWGLSQFFSLRDGGPFEAIRADVIDRLFAGRDKGAEYKQSRRQLARPAFPRLGKRRTKVPSMPESCSPALPRP